MQVSATTTPAPALILDVDLGAEAAALAIETNTQTKRAERAIQEAEESALEAEESREIDAMRQKADDMRLQGWIGGSCMAIDGAAQGCNTDAGKASAAAAQAAEKIVDACYAGDEGDADGDKELHTQASQRADQAMKDAHDAATAAQEGVDRALDFYRQYAQTQASANLAMVRRA